MLSIYHADLHIHIGYTQDGHPVKVTAARNQTLPWVLAGSVERKGLDLVGIVDAVCPRLCHELEQLVAAGELEPLPGGGLRYHHTLTLIPGAEIEATEANGTHGHWLAYFPTLVQLRSFSIWLSNYQTNSELSTQVTHRAARELLPEVLDREGIFLPAHAFTPHKGVYGQCTGSLVTLLGEVNFDRLIALELGLSADTMMADQLSELAGFTFISNSDAHSVAKIGREYNALLLERPDWDELIKALRRQDGRRLAANYGLDPRLGKYHRSYCLSCQQITTAEPFVPVCPNCGSPHQVKGVYDRLREICDRETPQSPEHRPPYIYQVPLLFLPGVGGKTVQKLLDRFGTEMNILRRVSRKELIEVVGARIGEEIVLSREGKLAITAGGGGCYGRVSAVG